MVVGIELVISKPTTTMLLKSFDPCATPYLWAGFKARPLSLRRRGRRLRRREHTHPTGRDHTPAHASSLRQLAPAAAQSVKHSQPQADG